MRDLADPEFRAYLDASLKRLNEAPSRDTLSGDEFLALMRSQTQ